MAICRKFYNDHIHCTKIHKILDCGELIIRYFLKGELFVKERA